VPVLLRLKSKNVATPLTAATGVVPLSVAPPGLLPAAMLTLPVKLGTGFPSASSARTFTAGLVWWSATVVLGSVLNTSCVAAPAVPSEALLAGRAGPGAPSNAALVGATSAPPDALAVSV